MKFTSPVIKELKYYVYIYSHPESGEIFYVGKGKGNRVFSHLLEEKESDKVKTIKDIKASGLKPKIEILIHGLEDEKTALRVESSIIDLLGIQNLTNKQSGYRSALFGRMTIDQINAAYDRQTITVDELSIFIRISKQFRYSMSPIELYDYTRGQWKLSLERAAKAKYAFAVYEGIVQEVYKIVSWHRGGQTFSVRRDKRSMEDRSEFVGNIAPKHIRDKYRFKSVSHYFKRGNANPILYVNV